MSSCLAFSHESSHQFNLRIVQVDHSIEEIRKNKKRIN